MKIVFVISLVAAAMICSAASAQQDTASGWYKKGLESGSNMSYEDAI